MRHRRDQMFKIQYVLFPIENMQANEDGLKYVYRYLLRHTIPRTIPITHKYHPNPSSSLNLLIEWMAEKGNNNNSLPIRNFECITMKNSRSSSLWPPLHYTIFRIDSESDLKFKTLPTCLRWLRALLLLNALVPSW